MGSLNPFASNAQASGFQAQGVDQYQLHNAYDQTQAGIKQQQDFVNALAGQNGLANQSNVFGQQQGLANQLQGVANGTGPNPAQSMLNQATGQNVSNQAALMAGQRGASQNVGLMARQAAMQGANTQQQAAGQGATMQAQQSLGAMNQLQGQQANMANVAQNEVANQQGGLNQLNSNSLNQQANLMGLQANINSSNAGIAGINAKGQQAILGGVMQGIGSGMQMLADGGTIAGQPQVQVAPTQDPNRPKSNVGKMFHDTGAAMAPNQEDPLTKGSSAMGNDIGKGIKGLFSSAPNPTPDMTNIPGTNASDYTDLNTGTNANDYNQLPDVKTELAKGGKVPAMVSPGEQYLPPKDVKKVAQGANPLAEGERIPGKPKYKGNNYANDTVPKTLESGGIVIPNKVMQSKNPAHEAKKFVAAVLAKQGKSLPKKSK